MIQNQWYGIYPSKALKKGELVGLKRLNEKIVLYRDENGKLGCLKDRCSHRGVALSKGKVKGQCVECPFHGLQFNQDGSCVVAPSLGKSSKANLDRFKVPDYRVREQYGIIYFWYGDGIPTEKLPFFYDEIEKDDVYSELEDHWNAFYSRCIENQLDVIHLPFVHHNTIGRGNKTLVNGPPVIFENDVLKTSAVNAVDEGQIPKTSAECDFRSTYLKFVYPNLWLNHITDKMRILIYFAPIDDENTILYVRFYSKMAPTRLLNKAFARIGKMGNKIVERQDKRVVITQEPKISELVSIEKLFPGDKPIIEYRRIREELKKASLEE